MVHPTCKQPPSNLPSDTHFHKLLVALVNVQTQSGAPLHVCDQRMSTLQEVIMIMDTPPPEPWITLTRGPWPVFNTHALLCRQQADARGIESLPHPLAGSSLWRPLWCYAASTGRSSEGRASTACNAIQRGCLSGCLGHSCITQLVELGSSKTPNLPWAPCAPTMNASIAVMAYTNCMRTPWESPTWAKAAINIVVNPSHWITEINV